MRSERGRVGEKRRYWRDWSSDVCSSDLSRPDEWHLMAVTTGRKDPAAQLDPCHVVEAGVLADEGQTGHAGRPVTVLGHDDLGHPLILGGVGVVDLVAIEEQHHVRVLFDRP